MKLKCLEQKFSVCKVKTISEVDLMAEFIFIGKTDEELSIVCETNRVPQEVESVEHGWRAIKIEGPLDFSLVGILAPIATILAEAKIGIFAISTFDTDYILVKEDNILQAKEVLMQNHYTFI